MTISVATHFLKGHPRHGEETFFVERILAMLFNHYTFEISRFYTEEYSVAIVNQYQLTDLFLLEAKYDFCYEVFEECIRGEDYLKIHTVRSGHRFKKGTPIHFKIWTGNAYRSKTFKLAPEINCTGVQEFVWTRKIDTLIVDGNPISDTLQFCENDGLSIKDLKDWFGDGFNGQVIHFTDHKY